MTGKTSVWPSLSDYIGCDHKPPIPSSCKITLTSITEITPFYQLNCWIQGRHGLFVFFIYKDKSHKHATVRRKLTEQTFYVKGHKPNQKPGGKKVFKTVFLETTGGFVISNFVETTSACWWQLLPFESRREPTVKWDFVNLSSYWRVCTYYDMGCLFPICSFAFTFANSIRQLIVTGVFVGSLWLSSSAWLEQAFKYCVFGLFFFYFPCSHEKIKLFHAESQQSLAYLKYFIHRELIMDDVL